MIYGTAGDPTRNVTVTNWPAPYRIQNFSLNCTFTIPYNDSGVYYYYGYSTTPVIYVGDYTRICIYLVPPNPNDTSQYAIANYNVTHMIDSIEWTDDPASSFAASETFPSPIFYTTVHVNRPSFPPLWAYYTPANNPIQIKLPYIRLNLGSYTLRGDEPGWMITTVEIYLRNN